MSTIHDSFLLSAIRIGDGKQLYNTNLLAQPESRLRGEHLPCPITTIGTPTSKNQTKPFLYYDKAT